MDAAQTISFRPHLAGQGAVSTALNTPSISLVLPALNEQEVIVQAIDEADEALARITSDYEILVVDDGSTDRTRELAEREARRRPTVRVLGFDRNRGYGAALQTGFEAAKKDYIGFTDADCQFDLSELSRLVLLLASCDIACGYRINRQDGWLRGLYSKIYNFLVRCMLGTQVRDCDCALKLFRRQALGALSLHSRGFLVNAELLSKANLRGQKVIEVGVSHRPRLRGESTVSAWHTIPVFVALVRFWWTTILFPSRVLRRSRTAVAWRPNKTRAAMASLALLAAVVFFGNLAYPFIEPDESRYAQIALEMVRSGDYVVPRLQGEPYLDKPPLLYWATAGSFQLFGVSELSARIPSALAATLTVLVTFLLGRRLLNDRAAYSGAILLFLCFGFVLSGRFVIMDGLLTLFTTTCLLAGFLALRGWHLRSGWWLVAAVACGLGMLTKGPIAPVLTIPPLLALQALSRYAARIHLRHWLTFVVVVAAITVPWFVAVGFAQPEFAGHFLWKHHVLRFVSAFNHRAPFWYYLPVLLIGMFPCSLLTAPIIAFLVGRTETLRKIRTEELGCLALAAVWIVGFFSVSSCKLPTYILPAVPLLCLVMGCMVSELLKGTSPLMALDRLAHQLPQYATTLAVLIGAMIAFTDLTLEPDRGAGKAINYCMLILAAAFLLHRLVHRRAWSNNTANWVVAAGACLLITVFAFQKFVPEFAGYRSIHANAARLQVNPVGKVLPVVYLDWQSDGYPFYLPYDHIEQFTEHDLQELTDYVRSQEEVVFVANPDGADMLREELGDDATFTRARGARGRLYVVTVTPRPTALFGSRRPERVQRGRMRR